MTRSTFCGRGWANSDRSLRFASRVALERQEIALWKDRAVRETNASAGLTALLALARVGGPDNQDGLLESLGRKPLDSLPESQVLTALRVLEVSMLRQGRFQPELAGSGSAGWMADIRRRVGR